MAARVYDTDEIDEMFRSTRDKILANERWIADNEGRINTNQVAIASNEARIEALEDEGPTLPPVEPPDGLPVPEDADWQWFIDHSAAPAFSFTFDYSGNIPAFDETKYRGTLTRMTDTGDDRVVAFEPGGTKLTNDNDSPIFIKVGQGTHNQVGISGFEVTGSRAPDLQVASMIDFTGFQSSGVKGCWVHHNGGNPVRLDGLGCGVEGSLMHSNEHLAIGGSGANQVFVSGNEFHHNSIGHERFNWEHGAIKLTNADAGLISGNYIHDERTHGIWTDINCRHDITSNHIVNCGGPGIFATEYTHPGRQTLISGNYLEGNAHTPWPNLWLDMQGQIKLALASNVLVTDNDIRSTGPGQHGLSLIQQSRDLPNGSGRWVYTDEIQIEGNRFSRTEDSKQHIKISDDTGSKNLPGFIPDFLGNWQNQALVAAGRAARVNGGTWDSIWDVNERETV